MTEEEWVKWIMARKDLTGDQSWALRGYLNQSAGHVARALGTTESSVYRWEKRGERHVPRMYALALRQLLVEKRSDEADQSRPQKQRRPGSKPNDAH